MNDEARRLLERIRAPGASVADKMKVYKDIDAFLAQPEPAAREERRWPEVAWRVGVRDADFVDDVRVVTMPCCGFSFDALHTDGYDAGVYTCPLCADTSPAAAALLAQGERHKRALKMITAPTAKPWWELGPGVMATQLRAIDSIARAALAPGEEKE